jgi:hypothetical protein
MLELQLIRRSLLLSALVLLSSILGVAPRSLAATDDPASIVGDLGTRALAAMRNGKTAAVQGRFRQLFRQHSEMVSVIQRNSGQMQALLAALREKNASNGILR